MLVPTVLSVALVFLWSAVGLCSCTNPEVRREWRTFSSDEKAEWIRAVKCLSQLPHDPNLTPSVDPSISAIPPVNASSSYYDGMAQTIGFSFRGGLTACFTDFVYVHMDLNTRIHYTGFFLPWHRWFVSLFASSLKSKCEYNGVMPYWNWTIDAPYFFESSFWKDSDPVSGLGGWGDPNADFTVPDGAFNDMMLAYPSPHTLRRQFALQPFNVPYPLYPEPLKFSNATFSAAEVEAVLETPSRRFKSFQAKLDPPEGMHGGVHLAVGGDLAGSCPKGTTNCVGGAKWAPNDALFWMHHAMLDKIWYDWQHRHPKMNANSFIGGSAQRLGSLAEFEKYPSGGPPFLYLNSTMPADGMFPEVTIGDVMNTTGDVLCYVYE